MNKKILEKLVRIIVEETNKEIEEMSDSTNEVAEPTEEAGWTSEERAALKESVKQCIREIVKEHTQKKK